MQWPEKLSSLAGATSPDQADSEDARSFDVRLEDGALWCTRRADAPTCVTLGQLREQQELDERLLRGASNIGWKVLASADPKVFCLGGDLQLFLDCIARQDEEALLEYGLLAAHCVWRNTAGFGPRRLGSIALVEGEAQGGGFEVALSCHWLVATRDSYFGFPESLFGVRPGMGARALLAARVGDSLAEKMVSSANRYSAKFLHDIGVVDVLVDAGQGQTAAKDIMTGHYRSIPPLGLDARRELTFQSLVTEVEKWVTSVMQIGPRHQRSMRYLLDAQRRRGDRRT